MAKNPDFLICNQKVCGSIPRSGIDINIKKPICGALTGHLQLTNINNIYLGYTFLNLI
jgi:hypothetical protein